MKPIQRLLLLFSISILFSGAVFAQDSLNYRLTGTFGGRFIAGGFDAAESIFFAAASTGLRFYNTADLSLVYSLELTNLRVATTNGTVIAAAYTDASGDYVVSFVNINTRTITDEAFIRTTAAIESLAFSPDGTQIAVLVRTDEEIWIQVHAVDNPETQREARAPSDSFAWELAWTADGQFVAAEINLRRSYLVFEPAAGSHFVLRGTEIYAEPASYPAALITTLETMNRDNSGYRRPVDFITSPTGRYQARYLEYGTGSITLTDTTQPSAPPRQLEQTFFGHIDWMQTGGDNLYLDFPVGNMCQIRAALRYTEQQFTLSPLKRFLGCVYGHGYDILTPLFGADPASDSFDGRFADAPPYSIVLVRVDDMGFLSENPEDQLLLEGHTGEIVYTEVWDKTHFFTLSQDQTARIWTINTGENSLELVDTQVIELGIVPTNTLSFLPDNLLAIADTNYDLHIFDFAPESPSYGERLQSIPSVGVPIAQIIPAGEDVFYTRHTDEAVHRWQND